MNDGVALNRRKVQAVTFMHCGACGWHYRFYAVMEANTDIYLGAGEDAYWDNAWGDYATVEAHNKGRAFLEARAGEILFGILSGATG